MAAAECTAKTIVRDCEPNYALNGLKVYYIIGTTAGANDFFTLRECSTIVGAWIVATDGTIGSCTFATNVLTITSAAKTYSGIVWGYTDAAH